MGSWPALSEVAQKARKEAEKENKPMGVGGEEGEVVGGAGKVTGKERKGGSVGGGGGERRVSTGGTGGGGGGIEKTSEGDTNGDSQRFSGRRKGKYFQPHFTCFYVHVMYVYRWTN